MERLAMLSDLRYAFRSLRRAPAFAIVAIVTLALGIGANAATFSVLNGVLLRPLPFDGADRLVLVSMTRPDSGDFARPFSYPDYADLRERSGSFESAAAWALGRFTLTSGEPELLHYAVVTSSFFSVLRVRPALGRDFRAEDDRPGAPPMAIISHGLWLRQLGGDPGAVGRSIRLNGRPFEVVGIMPAGFRFLTFRKDTDVWLPLGSDPFVDRRYARSVYGMGVLARLAPGRTIASAQADVDAIAKQLAAERAENRGRGMAVMSLRDQAVGTLKPALRVLMAAVGLVLLIACANVANLVLARAASRRREMAIRAALGAGRGRLLRHLLAEHLLLACAGGSLGLFLASWSLDLLALVPEAAPSLYIPYTLGSGTVAVDGRVLLFTAGLSLATTFLFGFGPALRGARTSLAPDLQSRGDSAPRRDQRTRSVLVVVEVALATALLVGAGLLVRTLFTLQRVDPGFDTDRLVSFDVILPAPRYAAPAASRTFVTEAVDRLAALPDVAAAGAVEFLPLAGIDSSTGLFIEGRPPDPQGKEVQIHYRSATPGYFGAMGIRLLSGRGFSGSDGEAAPRVALINETMARRLWPGEDPIGRRVALIVESLRFRPDGPPTRDVAAGLREIVGIVGDVRHGGLDVEAVPEMYVPFAQRPAREMTLVARTDADPGAIIAQGRRIVSGLDPEQPIANGGPIADLVSASIARPRFNAVLLALFTALALLLAGVGVYGVIAYTVARRIPEIGIRIALGGTGRDIAALVIGQGLRLAVIGLAAGLIAALALSRLLSGLLFGVTPRDPLVFAGAGGVLAAVALLASVVPAWRATRVDPIAALRSE
jgi:putative ABC transport system permease protein